MQLRDRSFGFLPCSLGFLLFRFVVKSGGSSLTAGPGAGLGGTASLNGSKSSSLVVLERLVASLVVLERCSSGVEASQTIK